MSKDYLQVKLGGKQRGLKFNMGTFRFIGELTGSDPLKFDSTGEDIAQLYRTTKTVIHAALLANCLSKGEDADFTDKEVDAWVSELSVQESTVIMNAFAAANTVIIEADSKKKAVVKN